MRQVLEEDWQLEPEAATRRQRELAARLSDVPPRDITTVAAAYATIHPERGLAFAAALAFTWPALEPLQSVESITPSPSGYVSGLLAWSLGPALCACLSRLEGTPDVLFLWGHGRAQPRGLGLAAHLGLLFDVPTIGCANRLLWPRVPPPSLDPAAGSTCPLAPGPGAEPVCAAVRTRAGARPLFVSAGHRMSLTTSVALTLDACRGYRIPEPLRLARTASRLLRARQAQRPD